jgi:hypothetical protein
MAVDGRMPRRREHEYFCQYDLATHTQKGPETNFIICVDYTNRKKLWHAVCFPFSGSSLDIKIA